MSVDISVVQEAPLPDLQKSTGVTGQSAAGNLPILPVFQIL